VHCFLQHIFALTIIMAPAVKAETYVIKYFLHLIMFFSYQDKSLLQLTRLTGVARNFDWEGLEIEKFCDAF